VFPVCAALRRTPLREAPASSSARGLLPGGTSSVCSDSPTDPCSPLGQPRAHSCLGCPPCLLSPSWRRPSYQLTEPASYLPRSCGSSPSSRWLSSLAGESVRRGGGRVRHGGIRHGAGLPRSGVAAGCDEAEAGFSAGPASLVAWRRLGAARRWPGTAPRRPTPGNTRVDLIWGA